MAVAALLHPEITQSELAAEALSPEEVRAPLVHGDDILRVDGGADPLQLAPDGAAIGVRCAHVARVEEVLPLLCRAVTQCVHVVSHFQERATLLTAVDDLVE